jgi:hypothetical protein
MNMLDNERIKRDHPLRDLFKRALDFGLEINPTDSAGTVEYIEEQILCGFTNVDNLYRIKDASGNRLEDIAEMLSESSVLLNADSFDREFQVHKHIGDFTLFMLSMFPYALTRKKGREFILGGLVIPGASLSEHYVLQGQRSYKIASEFTQAELFGELSSNYLMYKNILELVRIYLESVKNRTYMEARRIIRDS